MSKRPKTYWGFPVAPSSDAPLSAQSQKRGVALLITLFATMLMMGIIVDLIVTSSVNASMASATRDRIKSEYMAKSGLNLGLFLLSVSWGVDLLRAQPGTPAPFGQPLSDSDESLWNTMNDLPAIGADSLAMIKASGKDDEDPFGLKKVFSDKVGNTMALFEDNFSVKIADEGSKINLNDCREGRCEGTVKSLIALFNCPVEKAFLEAKDIRPKELAYRIKDFISSSTTASEESGYNDRNTPYQDQVPPYSAKGLPLDSLEELKLVAGVDEDVFTVFSPYLTVYPINRKNKKKTPINLNTVSRDLLGCLIPESQKSNCSEQFAQKFAKLKEKKTAMVKDDVRKALQSLACLNASDSGLPPPETPKLPPSTDPNAAKPEGGDLDTTKPENWFDNKSSTFRIEVKSQTGDQTRTMVAIIRRIMPKDKDGLRDKMDFKRSYEILHWKLI